MAKGLSQNPITTSESYDFNDCRDGAIQDQTQFEKKERGMNASLRNKAGAKVVVAGRRESEGQAVVHGIENSRGRSLFVKTYVALEAGWASRQQKYLKLHDQFR